MDRTPSQARAHRLEGLCEAPSADAGIHITIGQGSAGIERLAARFVGHAFSPHRHNTYAVGITLAGVQAFRYRGVQRYCLPGQCHILHPDELHDGRAGAGTGFAYRIAYVDPSLIQQALGGVLPFLPDPILGNDVFQDALPRALWRLEDPIDDVARSDMIVALADLLALAAKVEKPNRHPTCLVSLMRIRDLIAADPAVRHSLAALEAEAGLDRWALARQFRAAFGTSPSHFRTMRQLDAARRMITHGLPLAEAAITAGFADQSHMSRLFKRAYGLTPGKWATAVANANALGDGSVKTSKAGRCPDPPGAEPLDLDKIRGFEEGG